MEDKRIRINKKMVAWSDGRRTNIVPSVRRQVDNYVQMMVNYLNDVDEGYEIENGGCAIARGKSLCIEYEADHYWEQGRHLDALNEMLRAAMWVLPDESEGFEFEDMQWLDPEETLYWHPNVREFLRLNRRCVEYCKRDPRLWPVLEGSSTYRKYREYLDALGRWTRYTGSDRW